MYPCIHLCIHPYLSIYPSLIYVSIFINLSMYLFNLSIHPSIKRMRARDGGGGGGEYNARHEVMGEGSSNQNKIQLSNKPNHTKSNIKNKKYSSTARLRHSIVK